MNKNTTNILESEQNNKTIEQDKNTTLSLSFKSLISQIASKWGTTIENIEVHHYTNQSYICDSHETFYKQLQNKSNPQITMHFFFQEKNGYPYKKQLDFILPFSINDIQADGKPLSQHTFIDSIETSTKTKIYDIGVLNYNFLIFRFPKHSIIENAYLTQILNKNINPESEEYILN